MKSARTLTLALSVLCLALVPAFAGPIIESVPGARGEINWTNGTLRAAGAGVRPKDAESPAQARLLARQAAIADAYRNMATLISEVRVTGNTTVERYLVGSDTVRLAVEAYIRGAQVVQEREDADGTYRVLLQVGMNGPQSLSSIVLPGVLQGPTAPAPPGVTLTPQPARITPSPAGAASIEAQPSLTMPAQAPTDLEPELLTPADAQGPFTGLIIDARGLNVQPAMAPRVLDPTNKEVYGTVNVDPDYVNDVGIVGYMGTIRSGLGIARVGKRPLVVRAIGTPDAFHRYVTISAGDAQRVLDENKKTHFLQKNAVIFVVDERRGRDEGN